MKKLIWILLFLSFNGLHAQSLDDYLKIAEENNPGLKSKYAEFEAAMQKIAMIQSLPDPTFSMSALGQMIETRVGPQRAVFIINQMFPWFGTLRAQGDLMALLAEAKFYTWMDARNELYYKVKSAWYPFYELDKSIAYQYENKSILETYKVLALSRFKNGKGTMVDVIRVDIMIDDIDTAIKLLEEKRTPLLSQFNKLLNRDSESHVLMTDTLIPEMQLSNFSTDSILINNPKLSAFDKKIQSWQAQAVVAQKQGMPKLGVGLNYTIIGKRTDVEIPDNGQDAFMPMVSVSLPIYRKKYKAAVRESELMQVAMEQMKQDVSNELLAMYDMIIYNLEKAEQEYNLYVSQMEKTKQATDLLMSAYTNSGSNFEEVLRMQQQYLKYQLATATVTTEYFNELAKLDYVTAKNLQQ